MFDLRTLSTADLQDERSLAADEFGAFGPSDVDTPAFRRVVARLAQIDQILIARRATAQQQAA